MKTSFVRRSCSAFLSLLLLLLGCEGESLAPDEPSLTLTAVWQQEPPAVVGTPLSVPPTLRVEDGRGRPKAGVVVVFVVVRGGGSISSQLDTTDVNGEASTEWTLGNRLGTQELRAFLPSVLNGESVGFSVERFAGPPAVLELSVARPFVSLGYSLATATVVRDAAGFIVAAPGSVEYSSSNEAVASVSPSGDITGVAVGSAAVIASLGNLADTTSISVVAEPVPPIVDATAFEAGASYGIAVSPGGAVLLAQHYSASVLRRSATTGSELDAVALPLPTLDIAVRADGARALATAFDEVVQALYEIDAVAGTLLRTVPLPLRPLRVLYSVDGTQAYVTSYAGSLMRVDLVTLNVETLALVGAGIVNGIALSPDGSTLIVSSTEGTLNVISTASLTALVTVAAGGTLQGVTFSPDGNSVFVASESGALTRRSSTTLAVEASAPVGGRFDVELTSDGQYLVATSGSNVAFLDPFTLAVLVEVTLDATRRIAVDPSTGWVWVSGEGGFVYRLTIQ